MYKYSTYTNIVYFILRHNFYISYEVFCVTQERRCFHLSELPPLSLALLSFVNVIPTFVIVAFLITTSIYHYIGQTISSTFRLLDAHGSIIVGTQDLVVAPSAKLKTLCSLAQCCLIESSSEFIQYGHI